ncbi:MAG: glycosyltransferase family 2 protein [Gammaproteobacteria bacterium]
MKKLSLIIITKNAERLIGAALESGAFADEMLVLDSGSSDQTCAIAEAHGARVVRQEWLGFGAQKNTAVSLAAHDWVFVLDADERIPPALRAEILRVLQDPADVKTRGYEVPRLNRFFGRTIKTCGLYPDYTIRLFNRRHGRFTDAPVHERAQISGRTAKLQNPMVHLAYDTIGQFITKQNAYAELSRKKRSIGKALFSPGWTFFKRYVLQRGFLDGWRGFVICKLYAQYTFWKYIK